MRRVALALLLAGCTQAQLDTNARVVDGLCAQAEPLAPIAGPYAVWIMGACAGGRAVANLADDPATQAWLQGIIAKVRVLRGNIAS